MRTIAAIGVLLISVVGCESRSATSGPTTPSSVATLSSLSVSGASSIEGPGQTLQLHAIGTYSDGSNREQTADVTWTSSNRAVATVTNQGLVTSMGFGDVDIVASIRQIEGRVSISVNVACPSESDDVTLKSYGRYVFGHVGDDSVARRIIAQCSWHVYAGHNGGFGDQLEVASPSEAVVLVWSWNNFEKMRLRSGWIGKTDRGVRLGDSQAAVAALYKEFGAGASFESADHCVQFDAAFDRPGGALRELTIWNPEQFYNGAPGIATCDGR